MYTEQEIQTHRKLWTEALRSDRFKQGKGYLNCNGECCCLGVACEVFLENGGQIKTNVIDNGIKIYYPSDDSEHGEHEVLPEEVMEWLGVTKSVGFLCQPILIRDPQPAEYLTQLNDTYNYTFSQIADIIDTVGIK